MGAVYEARHAFTNRNVALKIITAYSGDSEAGRERFLREARAPSSIGHPALVEVFDAGVDEAGTCYLAMELLRGEGLDSAIDSGRLSRSRVVEIVAELLDALEAAHRAGMVHRDIKPENVFLAVDAEGLPRVKLLDFGISRIFEVDEGSGLTTTGTVLGTPHYMSPEQARGLHVDQRTDIYSIGAMLFSILTGRTPFRASNYNLLVMAIMTGQAPAVSSIAADVPPELSRVVDRALLSDPGLRWQTASEMRDALTACSALVTGGTEAVSTIETAPTLPSGERVPAAEFTAESPPPQAERPWTKLWIIAGAMVVLGGAFIGTLYGLDAFRRDPSPLDAPPASPAVELTPSNAAPAKAVAQPAPVSTGPASAPEVDPVVPVRAPPTGALVGSIDTGATASPAPDAGAAPRKAAPVRRKAARKSAKKAQVAQPPPRSIGLNGETRGSCYLKCHHGRVNCVKAARESEFPSRHTGRCAIDYNHCARRCTQLP